MKISWTSPRAAGFSLVELMLVVLLLGILLLVAVPSWQAQLLKGRRLLAVSALQELHMRQAQYFLHVRRYAPSLEALGYPQDSLAVRDDGEVVPVPGEGRLYRLSLTPQGAAAYLLTAEAVGAQVRDTACRRLTLNATGRRGAAPGAVAECW